MIRDDLEMNDFTRSFFKGIVYQFSNSYFVATNIRSDVLFMIYETKLMTFLSFSFSFI